MNRRNILTISFIFVVLSASAQTLPPHFAKQLVTGGITGAVAMAFAPDGRIFITEQSGKVRVVKNDILLTEPFVELDVAFENERGMLGVAVDPDFQNNQFIYLYYTVPGNPRNNRVSRFTADGDTALEGSEVTILDLENLNTAGLHNGGAMLFGPDGKLYISVGDAYVYMASQDLDSYNGKLLRINPDGSVPEGNPFTSGSEQKRRIWASGLRNPFTFSIQPETGRIFINDVGQDSWEEVNDATESGKNFGWPMTEGMGADTNLDNPIYTYPHSGAEGGCAIVGGAFFNPAFTNYPVEYYGKYFFNDICNGWISYLDFSGDEVSRHPFVSGLSWPMGLTLGQDGNLYYIQRVGGELFRIIFNATTAPYIVNHPANKSSIAGTSVSFNVTALGSQPLTYQWQKDGEDIDGETSSTYSIAFSALSHAGQYRVIVSNAEGRDTSHIANLNVIPNPPVAKILRPSTDTTYVAGTDIEFSGTGTDIEDGILPESAFSWNINFHHNTHKHDQPAINGVKNGTFHISNEGETSDNVWYRIILTVTDSDGLQSKDSVDMLPLKSSIKLLTFPPGLNLTIDGQPITTPSTIVGVKDLLRTVGVVTPQVAYDDITFEFESWVHSEDAVESFSTPTKDTTFVAKFSTNIPFIVNHPSNIQVHEWHPFNLSVNALGTPPLMYQWIKNGVIISGADTQVYTVNVATLSHTDEYRVVVYNAEGRDTSEIAMVTVIPNEPDISFIHPNADFKFTAGGEIIVKGMGSDYEDNLLNPKNFKWKVDLHNPGNAQTIIPETTGLDSLVFVAQQGLTVDSWYKVYLTATNSNGVSKTKTLDIYPNIIKITITSSITELPFTWDGAKFKTPIIFNEISGTMHSIYVPSRMDVMDTTSAFLQWDGGNTSNNITLPIPNKDSILYSIYQRTPNASIIYPESNFDVQESIVIKGSANDYEDGILEATSFKWKVNLHKYGEVMNVVSDTTGLDSLVFFTPLENKSMSSLWYRIYLTATDSHGITATDSLDIYPKTVAITLRSNIENVTIGWNGVELSLPTTIEVAEGTEQIFIAPLALTEGEDTYKFQQWNQENFKNSISILASDRPLVMDVVFQPNLAPEISIINLLENSKFSANEEILVKGVVNDPEDGPIQPDNFQWSVKAHYNEINFSSVTERMTGGDSLRFFPNPEHYLVPGMHYRVYLSATDADGKSTEVFEEIYPNIVKIKLNSNIQEEVLFAWNGETLLTPATVEKIAGTVHSITAPLELTFQDNKLKFEKWEDNNFSNTITFSIPSVDSTLTAIYQIITGSVDAMPGVSVFPNPVKDYLIIKRGTQNGTMSYQVFNSFGQAVVSDEIVGDTGLVDFSHQPSGIYFFKIREHNIFKSIKITKQ